VYTELFTNSQLYRFCTGLTLYITTPVELALAALLYPATWQNSTSAKINHQWAKIQDQ
jgi:hypothetical protein